VSRRPEPGGGLPRVVGRGTDDPHGPVRDEISFHIEKQVSDLIAAGWTEDAARAEAARRFGDAAAIETTLVQRAKWRRLRMGWVATLDETRANLALGFRQVRRRSGFAAAVVLLLGAGIGLGSSAFAVLDAAMLRPLPFPEPERLVYVRDVQDDDPRGYPASLAELGDWTEDADFFSAIAGVGGTSMVLGGDVPTEIEVGWTWGDWVAVVGHPPVAGRAPTADELASGGPVVLLDEQAWRERWGADPGAVGGTVALDDAPYTVIGVLPSEARLLASRPGVVLWMPRSMPEASPTTRGLHFLRVGARLADGVSLDDARGRGEELAGRLRDERLTRHGILLSPTREAILGDTRPAVTVLAGAALLVLLVIGVNLTILFASRTDERLREFAVRGALGAAAGRIARQIGAEALVLGAIAGVLGIAVALTLTGFLARSRPGPLEAVARADVRTFLFAGALTLILGLLLAWGPARTATGPAPGRLLLSGGPGRLGGRGLRRLLVGFEVALSVVLLASAGLLLRSVDRLLTIDPGFEPHGAVAAWITLPDSRYPVGPERVRFWDDLLGRVSALPGVTSTGAIDLVPLGGSDTSGGFEIVGRDFAEGEGPSAKKRFAGPGALEALGVPLLRGRFFTEADAMGAPEVAVVSRSLAERSWPGEDAIGKRIRFLWRTQAEQEIVGIVEDVRSDALDVAETGTIYVSYRQVPAEAGAMSLIVRASGEPSMLAEPIRHTLSGIAPGVPLGRVSLLEELVNESLSERTRIMGLLSTFATIALTLAALGLYAVTARSVASRKREIGIRKAIGAGRGAILGMVLAEEAPAVAAGLLLGIAASVPAARPLGGLLYDTGAGDLPTLAAVSITLGVAALAALLVPAWRAARVPPATAVRD